MNEIRNISIENFYSPFLWKSIDTYEFHGRIFEKWRTKHVNYILHNVTFSDHENLH